MCIAGFTNGLHEGEPSELASVVPYFFKYVPWPGVSSRRPSLPSRGTQACHRTQVHEPKRSLSFYNINTDLKGQWSLSVRCANVMLLLCSDMPEEVSRHWVIWGLWFAETSRVRMSCSRLTWPQWLQTLGWRSALSLGNRLEIHTARWVSQRWSKPLTTVQSICLFISMLNMGINALKLPNKTFCAKIHYCSALGW